MSLHAIHIASFDPFVDSILLLVLSNHLATLCANTLNCINCLEYFKIIWALYLGQVEYI